MDDKTSPYVWVSVVKDRNVVVACSRHRDLKPGHKGFFIDMLTQDALKELLDYDPATGIFTWRVNFLNGTHIGDIAGWKASQGYLRITYKHKNYFCHRLAFLFMEGSIPEVVDHLNGIKSDNRFCNLRHASRKINAQNFRKAKVDNKSGFLGVFLKGGRFKAKIKCNRKITYLGTYDTAEEAHLAYLVAKRELHEGCTI